MSENNHGCSDDEVWDEDEGKCVPKPMESVEADVQKNLLNRFEGVWNDLLAQYTATMTKRFDEMMEKKIADAEKQFELGLRKTFGLDHDPVVHLSELPKYLRKMQLEGAGSGKQTPASPGNDTGPQPLKKASRPELDAVKARYGWIAQEAK
jgi:hypothetical protein